VRRNIQTIPSADTIRDTDELRVSVDVTNTGALAGKEVVQLYIGDCESTVFRPVRELKGFEKVFLAPGETKTVSFTLDKRAFAYWNVQLHDWHVESGDFTVEIGASSRHIRLAKTIRVESTVELSVKFTVNSIFLDLMKSPKAMAVLAPLINGVMQSMGMDQAGSDAASAAISKDMAEAMLRYMPLRTVASFSGGQISYDQLCFLVDQINNA